MAKLSSIFECCVVQDSYQGGNARFDIDLTESSSFEVLLVENTWFQFAVEALRLV
jgi:hypothetical protein